MFALLIWVIIARMTIWHVGSRCLVLSAYKTKEINKHKKYI